MRWGCAATQPDSPWPGSSVGGAGGAEQALSSAGALLQLAAAEGVKLDVARDALARADHPLVAVSGLFPLGCSLQARRKHVHLPWCLFIKQQSCREDCVLLERDALF